MDMTKAEWRPSCARSPTAPHYLKPETLGARSSSRTADTWRHTPTSVVVVAPRCPAAALGTSLVTDQRNLPDQDPDTIQ